GALAAGVLALGMIAGAALGPSPSGSPADAATLAQRAVAALIARSGANSPASAPTSPASPPASEPAPSASAPSEPAKAATKAASTPASSENSSPSESSSGTPSSESSEGSSTGSSKSEKPAPGTPIKLPPVKHIWVIALSGTSFSAALADSTADPYLAKQLVPKGTLLSNYTLSASSALGNGIALLSGQGVNLDTEQNCPTYSELQPPTVNATTGLAEGVGCVYPAGVKTLAEELTDASLTWKAYVQDMDQGTTAPAGGAPGVTTPSGAPASDTSSATGTSTSTGTPSTTSTTASPDTTSASGTVTPASGVTCRRPELGAVDPNHTPAPGDPYLTYRNPFVYFDSLLGEGACASNDVDLSQLQASLATPTSTPSLSWIVPSACNDGSSAPCAAGAPAGLAPADSFLKEVVPEILATSAYSKGGLIVIVPDSPPSSTPASGAAQPVGALLLSPFVRSGARVSESFDDFSLLKSLSLLLGVLPLGHANDQSTVSFGATVYGSSGKAASAATTAKKAAQAASAGQPQGWPIFDRIDRRSVASQTGG
ncbi:MAG TPA: hypothetical protein VN845_06160, partial [Solirubrobacteraceae bacterium]|nr:hypothetical protein [Solirubrobacteraceae bacterium]